MKRSIEDVDSCKACVVLSGIYVLNNSVSLIHDVSKTNKSAEVLLKVVSGVISIGYVDSSMTFASLNKIKLDQSLNETFSGDESIVKLKLQEFKDAVNLINSRDSFKSEGIRLSIYDDRLELDVIQEKVILFNLSLKSLSDISEDLLSCFEFEKQATAINSDDSNLSFEINDRILASDFIAKEKDCLARVDLAFTKSTTGVTEKKSIRIRASTHVGLSFDTKTIGDLNCSKAYTKYVVGEKWGTLVKVFRTGKIIFSNKYLLFTMENDNDIMILLLTYSIEP